MSDPGPLVSVIIPCYKQAHYLASAVESVRAQTYPRHEIIVVDDGSPDDAAAVAGRYREVRCVRQSNQGLAAARNRGIRESRGEYLVFLDADDRLTPDALEVNASCLEARPGFAFVSGRYRYIAADGSPLPTDLKLVTGAVGYEDLLRNNHVRGIMSVMFRRWVFDRVGAFDTSLRASEDYDLYLRVAWSFPIYCHGRVASEYRRHPESMSRAAALMLKSSLTVMRSQRRFVRGDERREAAYREGVRLWQHIYGERLVERVRLGIRGREGWGAILRDLLTLFRYYPGVFCFTPRASFPA